MTSGLRNLYDTHRGKMSDKWASYLDAYDNALSPYRDRPLRMLEIGIQNGGSLEIWLQYFPLAEKLVGCDVNADCARLQYEDSRIQVVVGDANAPETHAQVLGHSGTFDIVLDDGSHRSTDIIGSFARYFPHVRDGGIYIAEDLHCSYWQDWEGGLYDPQSSIAFFKLLADVVNYQHWGVPGKRTDLFADFGALRDLPLSEDVLAQVHSVAFANSLCMVRKRRPEENLLGMRLMAGTQELVSTENRLHANTELPVPDNSHNPRSRRTYGAAAHVHQDDESRTRELEALQSANSAGKQRILDLEAQIALTQNSRSWRLTAPLRVVGSQIRGIASALGLRPQTPK